MGLEKVEIVDQIGEKDGGIVGASSEPDNDRIALFSGGKKRF